MSSLNNDVGNTNHKVSNVNQQFQHNAMLHTTQDFTRHSPDSAGQNNDMPVPLFKKKFSEKLNNNYGEFSERLI